jgi:cyclopropane fatty-acyl-phospholipid synthase-like methyltransferase
MPISEIYNKMLNDGANDAERVGWGSKESQEKRFNVLMEIGDLDKKSILDVGCGLGACFDFLIKRYPNLVYTGLDMNFNMIKNAQKKYPGIEFLNIDISSNIKALNNRKFDYVFLSGALNLSEDGHEKNIKKIITVIYDLANKGVAINFLSIFSDYYSPGEYYANPEFILKMAFSITSKVVLRHDYMNHDFTIYLYK